MRFLFVKNLSGYHKTKLMRGPKGVGVVKGIFIYPNRQYDNSLFKFPLKSQETVNSTLNLTTSLMKLGFKKVKFANQNM